MSLDRQSWRWLALALATFCALAGVAPEARAQGKKLALLVGVDRYPEGSGFASLPYTERDVEELAKVLRQAGYAVRLLTTAAGKKDAADAPTTANVRKAFAQLVARRSRGDVVLLALSGHGIQADVEDPDGIKGSRSYGYFCPADASKADIRYANGHSPHLILVDEL